MSHESWLQQESLGAKLTRLKEERKTKKIEVSAISKEMKNSPQKAGRSENGP